MYPANDRRLRPTSGADPRSFFMASRPNYDPNKWPGMWERPIIDFPAETVLGASASVNLPLPDGCCGLRFINLTGTVVVSLNGGGSRTVLDGDTVTGAQLRDVAINTAAASGVTVQTWGYGEPF